jgi:hypothetical protein
LLQGLNELIYTESSAQSKEGINVRRNIEEEEKEEKTEKKIEIMTTGLQICMSPSIPGMSLAYLYQEGFSTHFHPNSSLSKRLNFCMKLFLSQVH